MSMVADIRKGRVAGTSRDLPTSEFLDAAMNVIRYVPSPSVIKVDITSVCADLMDRSEHEPLDARVPRPVPPFRHMWLEGTLLVHSEIDGFTGEKKIPQPRRFGMFCDRGERNSEGVIRLRMLLCFRHRRTGLVYPAYDLGWEVTEHEPSRAFWFETFTETKIKKPPLVYICVAAHSFARFNCKNIELRPRPVGPKHAGQNSKLPSSVWHEIVVTSVPKFRTVPESRSGEHRDVRSHWVRGHYADYSKGNGLFGRIKGVFWMPEHKRGDESLGTVRQSYAVR